MCATSTGSLLFGLATVAITACQPYSAQPAYYGGQQPAAASQAPAANPPPGPPPTVASAPAPGPGQPQATPTELGANPRGGPPPGLAPAGSTQAAGAPRTEGTSKENTIATCGARSSYAYIASEFRCADGSNPFNGDLQAAADSRRGNVGANSAGHIIDLYDVPCPEGPQEVYVDMYAGCSPGESPFG